MTGSIRIQTDAPNLRRLMYAWQRRHGVSGAVHPGDPSTVLTPTDISIEALEDLLSALRHGNPQVEIVWRDPALRSAA
jgi:hypothetical protein